MTPTSVVVPVRNAVRTLPACLVALSRLDPSPAEILLVDNGSTDGSDALLRAFANEPANGTRRVIGEPRRGAAAARNAAVRLAQGEVIAFTDADCLPEAAWLRHLIEPFTDATVGAVAGRVIAAPTSSTLELFSALYTLQSSEVVARHRRWTPWEGGYPTANFAVRRRLLERLEGFDEGITIYGEDFDLCARLYALGAEIVYAPSATVLHRHRTTLCGMLRQAFGFGRSHAYLLKRHGGTGCWLDLPGRLVHLPQYPGRLWLDLVGADKKIMAILAAGVAYTPTLWLLPVYAGWLTVLARRRARRCGATASPGVASALAFLLILKSAAMTAGRWWGSAKYGVCCL
jgi:GT2 family glycosyltransferase